MSESIALGIGPNAARQVVYAQRAQPREGWLDRAAVHAEATILSPFTRLRAARLASIVDAVAERERGLADLTDAELAAVARRIRIELRTMRTDRDAVVVQSCALVREAAKRFIGMRPFDVQVMGAAALLRGMVAEMETGEGKTLTATLAAATAALAGTPVHIVTVNDYLARRDADTTGPLYRFLGLSVGTVVHGQSPEMRRQAYGCDIAYCTNKEIAFDYLRDRMTLRGRSGNLRLKLGRLCSDDDPSHRLLLRGLHFAIVDEADSVLIDEARTPLIISGEGGPGPDISMLTQALDLGQALEIGADYTASASERRVELTPAGRRRLQAMAEPLDGQLRIAVVRDELVVQALTALHLFHRDEHYLVNDGKVQIVDEYTGRVMPDRFWSNGLHQMIELKEGCTPTGERTTLARMTYQRFFRRYRHLAGMTGTAAQVARELWSVYRLPTATIPTNRPVRRVQLRDRVLSSEQRKWRLITDRIGELNRKGAPVLLGTRSVAASIEASRHLTEAGLEHVVLNAAQDREEASIIALAGQRGRITIATNMAGRGTDIRLGPGVAELGGLHVIMSERHDAGRIDRQLAGRCGRQGEPGCIQAILSLDDPLLDMGPFGVFRVVAKAALPVLGAWSGRLAMRIAQARAESLHSRMRHDLLNADRALGDMLALSGMME